MAASSRPLTRPGPIALSIQGFRDIAGRQRLIRYLVGADLKRTHADTAFGQLWWIFDPLLQMAVYVILVQVIFKRSTPDYPLFIFAAILPWKWFSTTLNDATTSVVNRQALIRQVQFPKVVLPVAAITAGTMSFLIGLIALGIVYLFYLGRLSPWVLLIPVIGVVQYVFTLALGVLLAGVNTFYRDVQNVLRHILRLWFYLSPALYSLPEATSGGNPLRHLLVLNPFGPLFESYRAVIYSKSAPDWSGLLVVLIVSLVFLAVSLAFFKRVEPAFARIL
ncbi:MAG TPA: ABC transporter permease [Candidatus Limnocylindrales bacterium]